MPNLPRIALLLAACALAGCSDDGGPTYVQTAPQAYVRYVNASPDSPRLVARFVDRVENLFTWDGVGFRGNGGYYAPINAGTRHLRVFLSDTTLAGASTVVLDTTLTLAPNGYYTLVQTGTVLPRRGAAGNTARVAALADTLPDVGALPAGEIRVRLINAGVTAPLDLLAAASTATADVGERLAGPRGVAPVSASSWAPFPALTDAAQLYRFVVRNTTNAAEIASARPNVPGQPYTAGSASGPPLDPVAGVRQGRSALSLVVFPAAVPGSPAASAATATPTVDLLPDRMPPRPQ